MTKNKQKGFTIIEVALVLAVAALIFLVVFLAVPALQRNQRDDARKRDVSNVVQAVTNATANTNAVVTAGDAYPKPSSGGSVLKDYLDQMSGNVDYVTVVSTVPSTAWTTTQATTSLSSTDAKTKPGINAIIVYTGAQCKDGGNVQAVAGAKRSAAVVVQVENGGAGKYYCQSAN